MALAIRSHFRNHALSLVLLIVAIAIIQIARSIFTYQGMAHQDFGTPARIASITELFERLEKKPHTDFIAIKNGLQDFGFPETRIVPASAIPKELFGSMWGTSVPSGNVAMVDFNNVLAHYDEHHDLRAIEFYGSRYGAFVSRDPKLRPKMRGELKQLAGAPLFITARITGGD